MSLKSPGTDPADPHQYEPLYGKTALIDGDILGYRCAFAAEHTYYLTEYSDGEIASWDDAKTAKATMRDGDILWNRKEIQPVEFALQALKTTIESITEKTHPDNIIIYLSGKRNFREDIAVTKPYKGGRDTIVKPVHRHACLEYMREQHGAITTDGYEADDAIGIDNRRLGDSCFIVTVDKDLDQCPGWHYNWVNDHVYRVSRRESDVCFYSQLLTGDSTDNIPGIRGMGPGKAAKLLEGSQNSGELFTRTWDTYRRGFDTPDAAWTYLREQANLVYILQEEGKFWEPPRVPMEIQNASK